MSAFLPVPQFFSHVYLVDLSPSLCEVARERFQRLGWKNVTVVCQNAGSFRLPDEDDVEPRAKQSAGADLVTMSYSLSMIPGVYSLASLLATIVLTHDRLLQRRGLIDGSNETDRPLGSLRFLR